MFITETLWWYFISAHRASKEMMAWKDMKIRLHMWNTKCNYKRNESDTACPLCRIEDTTEHIMVCQEENNTYLLDENEKDWEKIVAI